MPEQDSNLIGHLNLCDNSNYQAVYFSQLYGTFFGVYAKFTCKDDPDAPDNVYVMDTIDFKIVNYKGLINLGIESVKKLPDEVVTDRIKDGEIDSSVEYNLVIEVRALAGSECKEFKGCHDDHFTKGKRLQFDRELLHMHKGNTHFDRGIFDDEFFYREGIDENGDIVPETRITGAASVLLEDSNIKGLERKQKKKSGRQCPSSVNIII